MDGNRMTIFFHIWKDDKSVVALVEQYDEFVPVTRVYVRAEPVK